MSTSTEWVIGKTGNFDEKYDMGKQVGQPGQFGCAYLCTSKEDDVQFAVKKISKCKFVQQQDKRNHFAQLREEISVMKKLKHENIIEFHDVFETRNDLLIVMEACTGGELFDRIKAKGSYSEQDAAGVLKQILKGIAYLHAHKIAHCDLKPDNFLFLTEEEDSVLKIIDFGMSKMVEHRGGVRRYLSHFRGTPYYVAPEVLERKYSEHCDMWSFGVIMFVTLFGYPPFHDANGQDEVIFMKIERGFSNVTKKGFGAHFPKKYPISDSAKDLIANCLERDIAKRFTANEALKHGWFTGGASDKPLVSEVLKNLSEFTGKQKFKIAVLEMMTSYLSQQEADTLHKAFVAIDANGDGLITVDELKDAIGNNLEKASELQKLIEVADLDGDGKLSYKELKLTTVHAKLKDKEERIWRSFAKFDLNGDGYVSKDEIAAVLGKDSSEAKEIIAEVDDNDDGQISYEEFMKMWFDKQFKQIETSHTDESTTTSTTTTTTTVTSGDT